MISYKCGQQARGGIRLCARIQLCKVEEHRQEGIAKRHYIVVRRC